MKQTPAHVPTIPVNFGANPALHHVVDDPNTISLDCANRLIQVITTKCGPNSVNCAWALPHLDKTLQNLMDQTKHNIFSFFWQQHNHPEY
jgi:hypothetical protein